MVGRDAGKRARHLLVGGLLAACGGGVKARRVRWPPREHRIEELRTRPRAGQAAVSDRRALYAEFARDARASADGVHQYVMDPGPDPDADTAAYGQVLNRARCSYDVVPIEGPQPLREAAELFSNCST